MTTKSALSANQGMPCLLVHSDWPKGSRCDLRRPITVLPWASLLEAPVATFPGLTAMGKNEAQAGEQER